MALAQIPVSGIRPNPRNARQDLGDLSELAASIRAVGVMQPLVVTQRPSGWLLIDGHRRFAAAQLAGLAAVPCIAIRAGDESRDTALMLAAAMHKQLEPIERGRAFAKLRAQGLAVQEIARRTGYTAATVASSILLTTLPAEVTDKVESKEITVAQATTMARQLRTTPSASAVIRQPKGRYLTRTHRLAAAASGACTHRETRQIIGGVACGQCWEHAIAFDAVHGDGAR